MSTQPCLILASTSQYRAGLLKRLGVEFQAIGPEVDETAAKQAFEDPVKLSVHLAVRKTMTVAEQKPEAIVIGGDQVGYCNGQLLEKPGDFETAKQQLRHMAGQEVHLLTATAIAVKGKLYQTNLGLNRLTMLSLAEEQIERYLNFDEPFDCAGSFKLESQGIALFKAIETTDPTSIEGLPLIYVASVLRKLGLTIP